MKRIFQSFLILVVLRAAAICNAQSLPDRKIHITADTVSLPFTVYKYFPFITATINGVSGKLMFDTGTQQGVQIDDKIVPLKNGKTAGHGFVGSGQSFETHNYDTVRHFSVGNKLSFADAGPVAGHDFSYMNNITSNIIGLVGYQFFEGYLFKLDYKIGVITFYKNTPQRQQNKDFLKGEKVLAILDFQIRKLPNHPIIPVITATDTVALSFDTGQLGTLGLSEATKKHWVENGALKTTEGRRMATLNTFILPGNIKATPGDMELTQAQNEAAVNKAIGITEPNSITFGYGFLSQYKTVWDYLNKKLYLLER